MTNSKASESGSSFVASILDGAYEAKDNVNDFFQKVKLKTKQKRLNRLMKKDKVFIDGMSKSTMRKTVKEMTMDYHTIGFKIDKKYLLKRLSSTLRNELVEEYMDEMVAIISNHKDITMVQYLDDIRYDNSKDDNLTIKRNLSQINDIILEDYFRVVLNKIVKKG